jgi:hypothetical protein
MRSIRTLLYSGPPFRRCAVHHLKLQSESVPIRRHWVQIHRNYRRDAERDFPNAEAFAVASAHDRRESSLVWYCERCRDREAQWCRTYPDIAPNKDSEREPPSWAFKEGVSWR